MKQLRTILASILLAAASALPAQSIVDWTEGPGRLGLGYPVPVPVDTPLPFDGFRSYAGLHARHQDLDIMHDSVSSTIVGQTRKGRDIWAYRLGRGGNQTFEGLPRGALQFTGGIHAREWQSPEAVTGLMELLAEEQGDGHWIDYVLDHTSIVLVPVLNVDGFLQTQRYPRSNWLGVDNRYPDVSPRDGRMRRKNLRHSDEDLATSAGRVAGVDLNRNNEPAWPGPQYTEVPADLTYRGPSAGSEPETQALINATGLGPGEQLRFYADMHSFTRVFFSVQTDNARLNAIQRRLLAMASDHHVELPGNKRYVDSPSHIDFGIGTTSEYFADEFRVPSLTWEIEPGQMGGAEYGGFASNGNDGFILPESEIRRVRENLAETMTAIAYHMAGPPHLVSAELLDRSGRFTHWTARWQIDAEGRRQRVARELRPLTVGRNYLLRLQFNKPMRWRENGAIAAFPGRPPSSLKVDVDLEIDGETLAVTVGPPEWNTEPAAWIGLRPRYTSDTATVLVRLEDHEDNVALLEQSGGRVSLSVDTQDMTGHRLDANPATPAGYRWGAWRDYEGTDGALDQGGRDRSLELPVSTTESDPVLPVGGGHSAMWFNPQRSGEGWVLEILPDQRAVAYWFTFDDEGRPRWLVGNGRVEGNRIEFPELIAASGARFGADFESGDVKTSTVGSARMLFDGCSEGWYEYEAYGFHRTVDFQALTSIWNVPCGPAVGFPDNERASESGSWYDPAQSGQGLTVQWISPEEMMLVWFTFDPEGRPYWIIGLSEAGSTDPVVFPELRAVRGPVFGDDYDAGAVEQVLWGRAELSLDCAQGQFEYETDIDGFVGGVLPLERLTRLSGLECP